MHGEETISQYQQFIIQKNNKVALRKLLISNGLKCPEINPRKTSYIIPNNKKILTYKYVLQTIQHGQSPFKSTM
jgi:hypothetical protein